MNRRQRLRSIERMEERARELINEGSRPDEEEERTRRDTIRHLRRAAMRARAAEVLRQHLLGKHA